MSEKEVAILTRKVDQILHYLHNDEGTGEKGLVAKMNEVKWELSTFKIEYERNQAIRKATIGIWGFIGGGVLWIAKFLVDHLYNK